MAPVDLSSLHRMWEYRRLPSGLDGALDQEVQDSLIELEINLLGSMEYPMHLMEYPMHLEMDLDEMYEGDW